MTVKNADYPYTFGTAPGSVMAEIGGSTYEPEFGPDGKHFRLKPIDHEVYADALLRVIEENADEDGALRSLTPHEAADRADIGKSRNLRNAVAAILRDRGAVDIEDGTFWLKVSDNDDQPEETVPAPAKRDPEVIPDKKPKRNSRNGRTVFKDLPTPKQPVRDPEDRWEHFRAIQKTTGLSGAARWVAACMSNEIALNDGKPKEMSPAWLGEHRVNLSSNVVRTHQRALVEAGLFVRVDNGLGSKPGTDRNLATFAAKVPSWFKG